MARSYVASVVRDSMLDVFSAMVHLWQIGRVSDLGAHALISVEAAAQCEELIRDALTQFNNPHHADVTCTAGQYCAPFGQTTYSSEYHKNLSN